MSNHRQRQDTDRRHNSRCLLSAVILFASVSEKATLVPSSDTPQTPTVPGKIIAKQNAFTLQTAEPKSRQPRNAFV